MTNVVTRSLVLLAVLACVSVHGCLGQLSAPWAWGPVLGAPGEQYAAITWATVRSVAFDLRYGLAQAYDATGRWDETLSFERHEGIAEIWLQDLLPGSAYRYQLVFYEGDAVYPLSIGTLRTLPSDPASIRFSVYGATRSHPDRHRLVAEAIAADDPLLVFHAGGLVDAPTEGQLENVFWAIGDLVRSHAFLPVIGTREAEAFGYYDAFALPAGGGRNSEQWWSFDLGDLHFVGLDSTVVDIADDDAMTAQTAWLENDLAAAGGQLIVVFCHDALYSASYPGGRHEPLCNAWEPLFRRVGVDVVFSGSQACYEHIYRHGVHYVNTGGGGAPLLAAPERIADGTVARRYGLLHYVRCTSAEGVLTVEAIPVASVVDDTISLAPTGRSIDTVSLHAGD